MGTEGGHHQGALSAVRLSNWRGVAGVVWLWRHPVASSHLSCTHVGLTFPSVRAADRHGAALRPPRPAQDARAAAGHAAWLRAGAAAAAVRTGAHAAVAPGARE